LPRAVELGAVALRVGRRGVRREHPEDGPHVVVLRAERFGRALLAARLLVEREDALFLVAEMREQRLAQRGHAGDEQAPVARARGLAGRDEQLVAVAMVVCKLACRAGHGDPLLLNVRFILRPVGGATLT
jgi:hypothetical protein